MKVVVWLEHEISAFHAQPAQLDALAARHPEHVFQLVQGESAFLRALAEAEAALVWRFAADWYELGPRLRFVATPAAGREKLELDPSGRVPTVHGHFHGKIMAESLLAMVLFFSRRLDASVEDRRARRYAREPYSRTRRLAGQTALIVGYGPLGRECARVLGAMGMRIIGVKRRPHVEPAPAEAVHPVERLPALLPEADHVILTLPGDTGTQHLLSDAEFAVMRPSCCVYNLGRGNAIDEAALLRALATGKVARAFLDVFEREPLPPDSPLWEAPNLALLPHASAISAEYLDLWFEELSSLGVLAAPL
jgi:D-2-hydroxyacid dehydrogenase (NADP+)